VLTACSHTAASAQIGDTVRVDYTGTLDDGTVFDSTINASFNHPEPLEFVIGNSSLLPAFQQAVINMSINQTKNIHIPFEEAYGPHYDNRTATLNWSEFQGGYVPEIGEVLPVRSIYGMVNGTVLNISEEGVTIDANLLLAGKDLDFKITLVGITSPK